MKFIKASVPFKATGIEPFLRANRHKFSTVEWKRILIVSLGTLVHLLLYVLNSRIASLLALHVSKRPVLDLLRFSITGEY